MGSSRDPGDPVIEDDHSLNDDSLPVLLLALSLLALTQYTHRSALKKKFCEFLFCLKD